VLRRIVYEGSKDTFEEASRSLEALCDLEISSEQVRRITERIGAERVTERDAEVKQYEELPLVQKESSPRAQIPRVVALGLDGGRYQRIDESDEENPGKAPAQTPEPSERNDGEGDNAASDAEEATRSGHWREFKAGCLLTLSSEVHVDDPCPKVPEVFLQPKRVSRLAAEIHKQRKADKAGRFGDGASASSEIALDVPNESSSVEDALNDSEQKKPAKSRRRPGAPVVLVRSVLASRQSNDKFGLMMAAAAWRRGFSAASRKAFLGDGASGNWSVWRWYFPRYTPILDFIHLLSYLYAAAMAGRSFAVGWLTHKEWIQHAWSGKVKELLDGLNARQAEVGNPQNGDPETHPRRVVADAVRYVSNNQSRMHYDEYRRQGLPLTTCHVESTVKQINQRVKGTEKFWSSEGGESILQLRGDHLSDTDPMTAFWNRRERQMSGFRSYRRSDRCAA